MSSSARIVDEENPMMSEEERAWVALQHEVNDDELGEELGTTVNENFFNVQAPRAIKVLHESLINELASPELLPYQQSMAVVRRLKEELDERTKETDDGTSDVERLLRQLDADRVRYALSALARTRLGKIQRHVLHLVNLDDGSMSPAERDFAAKYCKLKKSYLTEAVLSRMGSTLNNHHVGDDESFFDIVEGDAPPPPDKDVIVRPNLNAFVVCRVNRELGEVPTVYGGGASDELAPMARDSVVTAQYSRIRGLLLAGDVNLM